MARIAVVLLGLSLSGVGLAREITVAMAKNLPPFFMMPGSGIEYEIIKETFASQGIKMIPRFVPFGRLPFMLKNRHTDAVATINQGSRVHATYSNPYVTYHNYAITLKSEQHRIDKMEDLSRYKILAFQKATDYLGKDYQQAVGKNPRYKETHNQRHQAIDLYKKRIQVVVADKTIFLYFRRVVGREENIDTSGSLVFHRLFEPTHYSMGFHDTGLRSAFEKGMKQMRKGRYQQIYDQYLN